jgi:hypothetical protein
MVVANPFYVVEDETGTLWPPDIWIWIPRASRRYSPCPRHRKRHGDTDYRGAQKEARSRGITRLRLDATPNAQSFYQKLGFVTLRENYHHSRMAGADLRCFEMAIDL